MDPTFLSILLFLITTIIYYFYKPAQTLSTDETYNEAESSHLPLKKIITLTVYFLVVVCTQFFLNAATAITTCGGSAFDNIGYAGLMTLVPWTLIFGSTIIVLLMWPGFKSVFSNIIGYFYVAGSANELFNELLINNDVENINSLSSQSMVDNKSIDSNSSVRTAQALVKLFGDTSLLINQIVPENFDSFWNLLIPLMKPELNGIRKEELHQKLLKLVISRDNIGEAMWYLYTAILLISIVQYNIASKGCVVSADEMALKHQQFLDDEASQLAQKNTTQYI